MRIAAWAVVCFLISAAWSAPSSSAPPGWPASLTIGTGSPGGVFPIYGEAPAAILTDALGIPVSTQATQGSDQNILLIESGNVQLGFTNMGPALQAWNGSGTWTHGKPLRSMRALFPMCNVPFQVLVLKSSGIHSFADMAGKRVGTGPAGTTGGTYASEMFKTLGVPVTFRNGSWDLMGSQMRSQQLDVFLGTAGVPFSTFTALDTTETVQYIPLSAAEIAKLRAAMPEFSTSVVPAGSYPSMTTDYYTPQSACSISSLPARIFPTIWSTRSSRHFTPITTAWLRRIRQRGKASLQI